MENETNKTTPSWTLNKISSMKNNVNSLTDNTIEATNTISQALEQMKSKSVECLLIFKDEYVLYLKFF